MDILWVAVGVCIIVGFLFYVLAQQWSRTIRQHSLAISQLSTHVQDLENRIEEFSLVPLEQVFTLSFRLTDLFWNHELKIKEKDWEFIRKFGSFVGSIKIERWRSHLAAAVTEVLPGSGTAKWQTRSLAYYPDESKDELLTLWELQFAPTSAHGEVASLELVLCRRAIELRGHLVAFPDPLSTIGTTSQSPLETVSFFRIPLDSERLEPFRTPGALAVAPGADSSSLPKPMIVEASAWQSFYSYRDQDRGMEWDLQVWDLKKKAQWESWKVLDHTPIPLVGRDSRRA
jgi:hypothetical protein